MKLLMATAAVLLSACSAQNEQSDPPKFHAEQIVQLSDDAFGCESIVQLGIAAEHYSKGEFSAWSAALRGPICFNGVGSSGDWTVYQTDGAAVQVGKASLEQYEAARDNGLYDPTHQYWVPENHVIAK